MTTELDEHVSIRNRRLNMTPDLSSAMLIIMTHVNVSFTEFLVLSDRVVIQYRYSE